MTASKFKVYWNTIHSVSGFLLLCYIVSKLLISRTGVHLVLLVWFFVGFWIGGQRAYGFVPSAVMLILNLILSFDILKKKNSHNIKLLFLILFLNAGLIGPPFIWILSWFIKSVGHWSDLSSKSIFSLCSLYFFLHLKIYYLII